MDYLNYSKRGQCQGIDHEFTFEGFEGQAIGQNLTPTGSHSPITCTLHLARCSIIVQIVSSSGVKDTIIH